jgi:oligopeptide transport system substrate-binding protein
LLIAVATAAPAAADNEVLRIAIPAEPETLDPSLTTGSYDFEVEFDLWEGLTSRDASNRLIPGAAESWDIGADGTNYLFHLRPNLRYCDGSPVHAADFVFMARRAATPATAAENTNWLAPIRNARAVMAGTIKDVTALGISAPDDRTVEIHLQQPSYSFLDLTQEIMPHRQADIEAYGDSWVRAGKLVSNGAFSLEEWVPGSHIRLQRNPNYWGASGVKLPAVEYEFVDDADTRLKMFREGEVDMAENPPAREHAAILAEMPQKLHAEPMVGSYYIALDLSQPPFKDNLKLRQALALVTDAATITDKVIRAGFPAASSYVPPDIPQGYVAQDEYFKDWPMPQRLAQAKQLYAEAGYGPDRPLQLHLQYIKANDQSRWVPAVAAMWREALGVQVALDGVEYRVWLGSLNHRQYDASADDWESQIRGDADILDNYRSTVNDNDVQFIDPAFDHDLDAADAATSLADHLAAYEHAERRLIDAQAMIPIYYAVKNRLISDRVAGWVANVADQHRSQFISLGAP